MNNNLIKFSLGDRFELTDILCPNYKDDYLVTDKIECNYRCNNCNSVFIKKGDNYEILSSSS